MEIQLYKPQPPKKIKMLLYGDSGTGKTRFAATFPAPLIVDVEDGLASVTEQVYQVKLAKPTEIFDLLEFLHSAEANPVQTVVIDSLTYLQELLLTHTTEEFPARRTYENVPIQGDYLKLSIDVNNIIHQLLSLPKHLVLIAHTSAREGQDVIVPHFIGRGTARKIAALMDVVGVMAKADVDGQIQHTLFFELDGYLTKDRLGLKPYYVNPSYSIVFGGEK